MTVKWQPRSWCCVYTLMLTHQKIISRLIEQAPTPKHNLPPHCNLLPLALLFRIKPSHLTDTTKRVSWTTHLSCPPHPFLIYLTATAGSYTTGVGKWFILSFRKFPQLCFSEDLGGTLSCSPWQCLSLGLEQGWVGLCCAESFLPTHMVRWWSDKSIRWNTVFLPIDVTFE